MSNLNNNCDKLSPIERTFSPLKNTLKEVQPGANTLVQAPVIGEPMQSSSSNANNVVFNNNISGPGFVAGLPPNQKPGRSFRPRGKRFREDKKEGSASTPINFDGDAIAAAGRAQKSNPSGKSQASAKRKLNFSQNSQEASKKREAKKSRVGGNGGANSGNGISLPASGGANPVRSYVTFAEALSADLLVCANRSDGLSMDQAGFMEFKKSLYELMDNIPSTDPLPIFERTELRNGSVILVCGNEESVEWILQSGPKLTEQNGDLGYIFTKGSISMKLTKASILIPWMGDVDVQGDRFISLLQRYNQGLNVGHWRLWNSFTTERGLRGFVCGVDEAGVRYIQSRGGFLYYRLGRVSVKLESVRDGSQRMQE